jgi:hypothetical protein
MPVDPSCCISSGTTRAWADAFLNRSLVFDANEHSAHAAVHGAYLQIAEALRGSRDHSYRAVVSVNEILFATRPLLLESDQLTAEGMAHWVLVPRLRAVPVPRRQSLPRALRLCLVGDVPRQAGDPGRARRF